MNDEKICILNKISANMCPTRTRLFEKYNASNNFSPYF